jgi:hypothetical protein
VLPSAKPPLAALVAIQKIKVTQEEAASVVCGVVLPEELACHLLGFLPKTELVYSISLVSTCWYDLSKSSVLWQTLDFFGSQAAVQEEKWWTRYHMGRFLKINSVRSLHPSSSTLAFPISTVDKKSFL